MKKRTFLYIKPNENQTKTVFQFHFKEEYIKLLILMGESQVNHRFSHS